MTVWTAVTGKPKYGVAIYNFSPGRDPGVSHSLVLQVGELVEILAETDDWYYGRRIAGRRSTLTGIFPKSYVNLRECTVDRTESVEIVSIIQPHIVQEITQTLREWGNLWKHLYVKCNTIKFKFIEVSMRALLELRGAILSGTLPLDQLKKVQRQAIYTMDRGNRELGMDITVRCATNGSHIDPSKVSTSQLYNLHVETVESIKQKSELPPTTTIAQCQPQQPPSDSQNLPPLSSTSTSYSFFASVRNFVCKMSEDAELQLSLYDGVYNEHFTESYVVPWSKGGLAREIDQLHHLRVLFTDLGTMDIKREKVYLVCYVIRIGGMEPQNTDNRRSSVAAAIVSGRSLSQPGNLGNGEMSGYRGTTMRRPLGVAAMDVTQILSGHLDVDDDKHHCVSFFPCEKDNLDSLLRKIISNKELKGDTKSGQGLWVSVKLLHGDLKQIREEIPHLVVGNVVIARKMGFPEVILPSDARNDLYLTLVGGSFTRGVGKSSDRNIQVTVKVCNQDGTIIPGVISMGGGMQALNEYNSVIYYHEDKPRWHEIFKICVPVEEFKLAHVVFLFKHRSSNEAKDKAEKPFCLAYTPLMQMDGTTLNDVEHNLCVYKVDSKKWPNSEKGAAACYLSFPSQRNNINGEKDNTKQKGFLSLMPKDSFSISTNVCSTKLTQNVELLSFLNWSDHTSDEKLRQSLIALTTVPKREVVKFLQDILDALFSILTQADVDGSRDTYDLLVFECLLCVITIVLNRKYHHFQPVLELYIKENFCATLAYKKLCKVLCHLVKDVAGDDENKVSKQRDDENKVLVKSLKCFEYLTRFIVRSRQLHAELTQRSDQHDFQELFQELLYSIVGMMHCETTIALISQGACLKYLPSAVPHIIQVFPEPLLSEMIGEILDVLPSERLKKQRLITVLDLVQGPLFLSNHCRCILLPHITTTIKNLIQNSDELELCVRILNEILTLLFRNDIGSTDEEFNHLTLCLLRTIIQATIQMDRENPLVCPLVSVLLEMFRQMSLDRYNEYISRFSSKSDLLDFIMEILVVLRDCVEKPVFQKHWADMINLQNSIVLNTLRLLSYTLVESFLQPIEEQVWSNWFHLSVVFLTQPSLQLETLSPSRRRRMTARHGDMRRESAFTVRDMWFKLEDNKSRFLPALVGPFLEMSLLPEVELRKATIPLFFDMMLCEFNNSIEPYHEHCTGNFNGFENEMIVKLDVLVEGGSGDAQWSELFVNMVGERCSNDPELAEKGGKFVSTVGRLLDILLQYRDLHDHSSLHYRMQATTTLLGFYSDIKRHEMYIRYVNKLCDLHLECEDWTEAGNTLQLHAAILKWSNAPLSPLLTSVKYLSCQTHRDLKDAISFDIISFLEKGQMWESALEICNELAEQYKEVYDYGHLSELHERISRLYKAIVKQDRPQPEYFRVGYYGKGFPEFLQNKVFVYRGKEYERLQDFCARTLNGLPNAELMTTLAPPSEDIKNSNQQYVQVNAVEPLMSNLDDKMLGKPISDRILKYHQHNNVSKFRFSRPFHRKDEAMETEEGKSQNEFSTMWLERTELEIRDKLPGILRWCIVSKSETHEMSPLQVAVETMREANKVLKSLVIEHRADPKLPLDPLTRKLNGMVDAAVMGGTANYEKAFFCDKYMKAHPDHKELINTLKDLIASQIPLLEFGIDVHKERISSAIAPLHQRIVECFEKMKQHVHENYGKKSCDLEKEISMVTMRRQRKSMNERGMSFNESSFNNRLSSISTPINQNNESSGGRQTPLRALTAQFNRQVHRGSLSNGLSNGYASLVLPTAASLRSPVTSLLASSPAKKRDKEKRRNRKSEASINNISQPTTPSGCSQWYTSTMAPLPIVNGSKSSLIVSSEPVSSNVVYELRQELTPSRPLRSEVEKEKRLSQRPQSLPSETNSNRNSAGTTDSNMSAEDDPPPLPQKTIKSELTPLHQVRQSSEHRMIIEDESLYQAVNFDVRKPVSANASPVTRRQGAYDKVMIPRGSFLYSSFDASTTASSRKEKTGRSPFNKERAPTPPPKKRQTPVQT